MCGEPRFGKERPASLLNPGLVVEVLSPPAPRITIAARSSHHRRLASVREVMLIAPNERRVELYRGLDRLPGEDARWLITNVLEEGLPLDPV